MSSWLLPSAKRLKSGTRVVNIWPVAWSGTDRQTAHGSRERSKRTFGAGGSEAPREDSGGGPLLFFFCAETGRGDRHESVVLKSLVLFFFFRGREKSLILLYLYRVTVLHL